MPDTKGGACNVGDHAVQRSWDTFHHCLQPVTLTTAPLESEIMNGYKIKESF